MTAVLATKLFEPRVPRALVSRPRLVKRFVDGLSARVTVVSAPAGYGKSTLLGEWRESPEGAGTRLAWMSVDEADNDSVRFWMHVVAALQRADPGIGAGISDSLQRPAPGPLQPELERLVNELAGLAEPLVLVLDDLHTVSSAAVVDSLAFLVAHLPPQVRVVVVSRADPPLPLAALRARGDLSELRMPDLRFTRDELEAYFDGLNIPLDDESLGLLESRTEGWAAGLHLAAFTLADVEDRGAFVRQFAGDDRTVVDYLADEALARQPPDVQDFLFATSVLERMCGPLCDAVTGESGGQAMLRALENANLFLVALDNTRTWFRYHHLFGELLRRELRARRQFAETELRERAARWLAEQGLIEEAVPHAVAARAWDLAIELGTKHGLALMVQGQSATLQHLYGAPDEELRKRPEATLGFAWLAVLAADLEAAQRWLEASDVALAEMEDVTAGARVDAEILRALLADRRGDIPGSLVHADRIFELLDQHAELVGLDRTARQGRALLFQARAALWHEDFDAALNVVAEAARVFHEHQPARGVIEAGAMQSLLTLWDGRGADTRRDADAALELEAERHLTGTTNGALAHLALGIDDTERLELGEAERYLSQALDAFRTHHDVNGIALATAAWADRMRLAGNANEASATVRAVLEERRDGAAMPHLIAHRLARAGAMAKLALGDVDGAEAADQPPGDPTTPARVALARGRAAEAVALAERAQSAVVGPCRRREEIEALSIAALGHALAGDRRAALGRLAEAFRVAAPLGWLAPFVELGPPVRTLLAKLPPDPDPAVARLRKQVLDAFAGRRSTDVVRPAPVEQLSERELAVLRRLPSSLSNQEIAGLLYVSLNTIKTQIQSIYRKLGVNSRHEAIERARQLDLL